MNIIQNYDNMLNINTPDADVYCFQACWHGSDCDEIYIYWDTINIYKSYITITAPVDNGFSFDLQCTRRTPISSGKTENAVKVNKMYYYVFITDTHQ